MPGDATNQFVWDTLINRKEQIAFFVSKLGGFLGQSLMVGDRWIADMILPSGEVDDDSRATCKAL
jgi:hypothetical protein